MPPSQSVAAAVGRSGRPQADRRSRRGPQGWGMPQLRGAQDGTAHRDMPAGAAGYLTRIFSGVSGERPGIRGCDGPSGRMRRRGRNPRPPCAPSPADHLLPERDRVVGEGRSQLQAKLDMVWTSKNYHDVTRADYRRWRRQQGGVESLKPGRHITFPRFTPPRGRGIHRTSEPGIAVDPDAVKTEVMASGFAFVGSSDVSKFGRRHKTAVLEKACTTRHRYVLKSQTEVSLKPGGRAFRAGTRHSARCPRSRRMVTRQYGYLRVVDAVAASFRRWICMDVRRMVFTLLLPSSPGCSQSSKGIHKAGREGGSPCEQTRSGQAAADAAWGSMLVPGCGQSRSSEMILM